MYLVIGMVILLHIGILGQAKLHVNWAVHGINGNVLSLSDVFFHSQSSTGTIMCYTKILIILIERGIYAILLYIIPIDPKRDIVTSVLTLNYTQSSN